MNQKELREIRRRFSLEKDSISHIYGCYVNAAKEIVTKIDMSIGMMEQEEAEMYIKVLKKSISGTLGKNLLDIAFSTAQVENSDEHKLLQALRQSHLRDEGLRDAFYQRVIETLDMGEDSYVILLANDSYDVPFKGSDDEIFDDGGNEVFEYIVCGICPVKDAKAALRYKSEERAFKNSSTGHIIATPDLGFMFPAFDNRAANIYNALYYSRNASEIHDEFIKGIFNVENVPMSAGAQKVAFGDAMSEALGEECSLEVVQAVHEELRQQLLIHKENKEIELPELYIEDVGNILKKSGISDEKITSFNEVCQQQFGNADILNPNNLIETNKFEMKTPEVKITVNPEHAYRIKTRVIDGEKFIMIPVSDGVEVNGIDVSVEDAQNKDE